MGGESFLHSSPCNQETHIYSTGYPLLATRLESNTPNSTKLSWTEGSGSFLVAHVVDVNVVTTVFFLSQVGPLTSPSRIHCMTNHLTSFGSGMFVAPNPIDFSKALAGFKNAFETGNVVVMFTILFLLLLYALLAIWAWRTDRKDAMQVSRRSIPCPDNCLQTAAV